MMNCNEEIISGEKKVKMLHEYFDDYIREEMNKGRVIHEEGELYKVITAYGKTFELYYGYYEDCDRENPLAEPMPIYPNFIENPVYTDEGIPFVTAMQDPCKHYKSKRGKKRDVDDTCADCTNYEKCDEFLGVCQCNARRKKLE